MTSHNMNEGNLSLNKDKFNWKNDISTKQQPAESKMPEYHLQGSRNYLQASFVCYLKTLT